MKSEFAIPVRKALPGIEGGQRRRPERRDQILDGGEIGDAGHADLAVRPALRRQPADRVEAILGFLDAVMVEVPFRLPGAARVDDGDGIAARTPVDRIRSLERRQRRQPFRVHARSRPEDLVRQRMLAIGTPGEEQRQVGLAGGALRPVEIGIDKGAVAQRDREVALDRQAVLVAKVVGERGQRRLVRRARRVDAGPHDRAEADRSRQFRAPRNSGCGWPSGSSRRRRRRRACAIHSCGPSGTSNRGRDPHVIIVRPDRLVARHALGDLGRARPAIAAILEIDDRAVVGLEQVARVEVDHAVRADERKVAAGHGNDAAVEPRPLDAARGGMDRGADLAARRRLDPVGLGEIDRDGEGMFETGLEGVSIHEVKLLSCRSWSLVE